MMPTNKQPIHCPLDFLRQLRAAIKVDQSLSLPDGRRCVIVRCLSSHEKLGSIIIQWEGTPPRSTIFVDGMGVGGPSLLLVRNKQVKSWEKMDEAYSIIKRFLDAHPASPNGSPVRIGCANLKEAGGE